MNVALVDSHCHLDYPQFSEDFAGTVARARNAGVGMMVSIGVKLSTFENVRAVAAKADHIYCTVGVHPHDAQEESFRAHIAACRETGLPLIVHTRDADDDTMDILEEEYAKGPFTGVIHCFSSSAMLAQRALKIGFYISCSGIITFNSAKEIQAAVADVPLERLLVETDAPYLAPVPKRGKPNEPSYVAHTAAKLAEIKGVSVEEIARATTDNFFALFTKADRKHLLTLEADAQ